MNMKLTFDIPKEYSDMNRSELSQLYMKLKGVLEQIERAFENINSDNLATEYREKIEETIESAAEYKKEVEGRGERVFVASLPYSDEATRTVESELITERSIITIQPTVDDDGDILAVRNVRDGKFEVYGGYDAIDIVVLVHEEVIP